jgi:hypothetical protein
MRLGDPSQPDRQGGQMNPGGQNANRNAGDARGGVNPQDARNMRNQAGEFVRDAQALRNLMGQAGLTEDVQAVDDLIRSLRQLEGSQAYENLTDLQQLQSAALTKAQQLELNLRKRLDTTNDQLFLSGSEDVPPQFKSLIEEYYRRLSKKTGGG